MSSVHVPDDVKIEVENAFETLNSPMKLAQSGLISFCVVQSYLQEHPDLFPYLALKAVLADVLDALAQENPDYADILRGRFWEGLSPAMMILNHRPHAWAPKTFYNYQKKARNEFYFLLWQREQNCQRDTNINPPTLNTVAPTALGLESKTTKPNFNIWGMGLLATLLIILVASIWLFTSKNAASSPSTSTVTSFALTPTLTLLPSLTETVTPNPISACGETEEIAVDPNVNRFLRHQGVSDFTVENTPGLLNNMVRKVVIDQTGLWIGYFNMEINGLQHYDKVKLLSCNFQGTMPAQNVNAIAIAKSGKVWVGTEKNGIRLWDGKKWSVYTVSNGLPSNEIYALTIDSQDNLWAGTAQGIAEFDGISWSTPYALGNNTIFHNDVHAIAFDNEQNIWVGHVNHGVSEYEHKSRKWISYTTVSEKGLAGDKIRRIMVRSSKLEQPESVWFATADGGVSRFEQGKWTTYRVEDGLPSNGVNDLALDRYNRVWVATDAGVAYFDGKVWKLYDSLHTNSIAIGNTCTDATCPFDDDHVWTGTPTLGLTHSRLPLPDSVIRVSAICFQTERGEQTCPPLKTSFDKSLSESIITATFETPVKPGEALHFEITVSPQSPYRLQGEPARDFLSNTDEDDFNLFQGLPKIIFTKNVAPGESYLLSNEDIPFIAPKLSDTTLVKQFTSTWRIWMYTRYVGPYIRLLFTVKNP